MRPRIRKKNKENYDDTLLKVKRNRDDNKENKVLINLNENKSNKENFEKKKKEKHLLDQAFNLTEKYFYQELNEEEWKYISNDIVQYLLYENLDLEKVFKDIRLNKGPFNAKRLMEM